MINLLPLSQAAVSLSVLWVWTVRNHEVTAEFQRFRLSNQMYVKVGILKVVLAILLALSIWIPVMSVPAGIGMCLMMVAAQWYHEQFRSPVAKRLPSAILGLLCLYIIISSI
jgi:hypothetical protein